MLRDTQYYAHKFNLTKSRRIALRTLAKDQLGITIQDGEHDSVCLSFSAVFFLPITQVADARATMDIYRLHRSTWEKPLPKRNHDGNPHKRRRPTPQTVSSVWWPDLP